MSPQPHKSSDSKPHHHQTPPPSSRSSSHLVMVELKQRILTSISKLSDRDPHHIAVEELEKTIQTLSPDTIPMILNCLLDAANDPKPSVKKESLRLITVLCFTHRDSTATHLPKIVTHVVKRLRDSDSGVRDACRDAIGALSAQNITGETGDGGANVAVFVKPLWEAMAEQNKGVQSGAAACIAKMVECASCVPVAAFQKLCPRICKLLNNPNFWAKASLLHVVASLSQVCIT